VKLSGVRLSFCLSVRPIICLPHCAAAGLLLSAVQAGDIDRQRRPLGAQQQLCYSVAHSSRCEQGATLSADVDS